MPYKDPEKQKKAQRQHYLDNKEKYRTASNRAKRAKVRKLNEYKSSLGCSKCPEKRGPCLDFHHPNDDKKRSISRMVCRYSMKRIMEEVIKCVVLCRNCHAIEHWTENNICV